MLINTECPIWGANCQGFHGAGNAALMFRGVKNSEWRTDQRFLDALAALKAKIANKPFDAELLIGPRAILGQTGLMKGREGYSYGIITTEKPGEQGMVTSEILMYEMVKLMITALNNPSLNFYCLAFGLKRPFGYSWWDKAELKELWRKAAEKLKFVPKNLRPPDFAY